MNPMIYLLTSPPLFSSVCLLFQKTRPRERRQQVQLPPRTVGGSLLNGRGFIRHLRPDAPPSPRINGAKVGNEAIYCNLLSSFKCITSREATDA